MGWISDSEAIRIAKEIFSPEAYADFVSHLEMMRHLEQCVETNTRSPRCSLSDRAGNLNWCRIGLQIESQAFEDYLQEIIPHQRK